MNYACVIKYTHGRGDRERDGVYVISREKDKKKTLKFAPLINFIPDVPIFPLKFYKCSNFNPGANTTNNSIQKIYT